MSTIASLVVNLSLDSARFSKGTNNAAAMAKQLEQSVGATMAKVTSLATAGLAALGALITGATVNTVDQISDMAGQLGVTTEALSQLQYAADLNGSSAEAMDRALGKMNQTLGDVAGGAGGETRKALEALGLRVEQIIAMAPDRAFIEIADALSKVDSPARRASLAVDIFGKAGEDLINVLKLGRAGLEAFGKESNAVGNTLRTLDAESIGEAKDAFEKMGKAVSSLGRQIAIATKEPLIWLSEWLTKLVKQVRAMDMETVKAVVSSAAAVAAFSMAATIIPRVVTAIIAMVKAIQALAKGQAVLLALMGPKGWVTLAAGILAAAGAVWAVNKIFEGLEETTAANVERQQQMTEALMAQERLAARSAMAIQTQAAAVKQVTDRLQEQIDTFGMSAAMIERYRLRLQGVGKDELAQVAAMQDRLDQMIKQRDRAAAMDQITSALNDQIATFGMGEGAAALYRLAMEGVAQAELDRVRALYEQLDILKQQQDAQRRAQQDRLKPRNVQAPEAVAKATAASFLQQLGREQTEAERLRKVAEDSYREQQRQTSLLSGINDKAGRQVDDETSVANF